MILRDTVLDEIIEYYLGSNDFNGISFKPKSIPYDAIELEPLFNQGLIQAITPLHQLNPHIKRYRGDGFVRYKDFAKDLSKLELVCFYPTVKALQTIEIPERYKDKPYSEKLARGGGQLEVVFFDLELLERYQNDPNYIFIKGDFDFTLSTEANFEDEDKSIYMQSLGYGFDYKTLKGPDPHIRYVSALVCDLAKLSGYNQRLWSHYEAKDASKLLPHQIWYESQLNKWPTKIGWSTFLQFLLRDINSLSLNIWKYEMFKKSELPTDFGWVLRPTTKEWEKFVGSLDKLLSDNLNLDLFIKGIGLQRKFPDGTNKGTISLLKESLMYYGESEDDSKIAVKPLQEVRALRSKPAHNEKENEYNWSIYTDQVEIMKKVTIALSEIRHWLLVHPNNKEKQVEFSAKDVYWY